MRMKLPEHATSFGFDGVNYEPDEKGMVDIPEEAKAEAERHGLSIFMEPDGSLKTTTLKGKK